MQEVFANDKRIELEAYITDQLDEITHLDISEYHFNRTFLSIKFRTIPIFRKIPHFYHLFIWIKRGLYHIKYDEYYYKTFHGKPTISSQLYDVEDFDDVLNVLEEIFDTLRPRDEY